MFIFFPDTSKTIREKFDRCPPPTKCTNLFAINKLEQKVRSNKTAKQKKTKMFQTTKNYTKG